MNHIAHDNIFEYLSVDMDMEEDDIRNKLHELGTKSFIEYLKEKEVSMFKTPTLLSAELRDTIGSVLINKDIPLDLYLDTLLDRYLIDTYFTTSPFAIQTSDEILKIYKKKATIKVFGEIDKIQIKQEKYLKFYKRLATGEIKTNSEFEGFLHSLLGNTEGISFMLKMMKTIDMNKIEFTQTTNSTYLCITLALLYIKKNKSIDQRTFLQKIACTTFLQNAGLFSGLVTKDAHNFEKCKKAAMVVDRLCKDKSVTDAVKSRHSYVDDMGKPVFDDLADRKNMYKSFLMSVNLFIDIVKKNKFAPENIEVHKAMYELSMQGFADRRVVVLLGELFLPRIKHQLLEFAFKIQDQCNEKPIIWGIAGDMLPIKFICNKEECRHAGTHKTLVPQDVKIVADEIYETKTKRGMYYTCDFLTNRLQIMYKGLQKEMKQNN
ncbi:MAG: hypothetical protein C0603_02015 [Denitrovibrio sp.]|nr:MAG: hypothetical protein C0603_02015 [Denitrovibrio sp.]